MSRFFIDRSSINLDSIEITGDDVSHIRDVLRLKSGDNIVLCDGQGIDFLVKIKDIGKYSITADILKTEKNATEPSLQITLCQGLPKSDKMDFIIQKSVELGVRRIIPVICDRSIVKLDKADEIKKVARWRKIAIEAAKQCNRGMIPEILLPEAFEDALRVGATCELSIIPYEKETNTALKGLLHGGIQNAAVFIGPEGGFTDTEVKNAASSGIRPVTLGPRILRTETAGIMVLSILLYAIGDV